MPDNRFYSFQPASPREARNIILIVISLLITGLFSVYFSPSEFIFRLFGIETINGCPLLTFTGVPCPFCGMGRVFSCMLDLYITQSFYYNPLGLIFYFVSGIVLFCILILALKKKKIVFSRRDGFPKKSANKLIWIPIGFFILMWILNILFGHHT